MRRRLRTSFLILIGLISLLGQPRPLMAQETSVVDLVVTNSSTDLLLYFTVKECFTKEIMEGVHNGIPATFTFLIELYQVKKGWSDKEVVTHTFSHTMTFDTLKEEYRVVLNEKNQELTTSTLNDAKELMAEVNGFRMLLLDQLEPESSYRLRVKAKLAKKTLPLYFHYLIPFSSLWDFETDWHSLNFSY